MPQPLSKINPNAHVTFGGAKLQTYPKLASLAMETIAAISYAENAKGKLLAVLLGAESQIGLAMFTSLTSTVAQDAALSAAADISLTGEDKAIFDEIKRITKPFIKKRNDFAHHMWGISDDIPDALLLLDSKNYADESLDSADKGRILSFDRNKILVYKQSDLERDLRGALQTAVYFQHFYTYLAIKTMFKIPDHITSEEIEKSRQERAARLAWLRAALPTP